MHQLFAKLYDFFLPFLLSIRILSKYFFTEKSFSQEGEDRIVQNLFICMKDAFNAKDSIYIDVGAYHPIRFSNTYLFYLSGCHGVNIDACPGSMRLFRRWRRRDINIELGISALSGSSTYYQFSEKALNTFDPALAEERKSLGKFIGTVQVLAEPLAVVLDRVINQGTKISFLNVDCEGVRPCRSTVKRLAEVQAASDSCRGHRRRLFS